MPLKKKVRKTPPTHPLNRAWLEQLKKSINQTKDSHLDNACKDLIDAGKINPKDDQVVIRLVVLDKLTQAHIADKLKHSQ